MLVINLIGQNSTKTLDQDEFQRKYDSYDDEHKRIIGEIETMRLEIEKKDAQAKYLHTFINDLSSRPKICWKSTMRTSRVIL